MPAALWPNIVSYNVILINTFYRLTSFYSPILFSSAGEGFGSGMTRTKAVITNEGLVSLNVPTIIESSCKIRVDNYPFDQQNCELKFGSWTYDAAGIQLTLEVNL